ncbi:unnamed protein product [Lathyrus sativus]|nr:unnamed protein product [Lathyrus sativus]
MAIQLTVLPNSGFSISLTFQHVAGDGRSLHHFMKYWASLSKASANNNDNSLLSIDLPFHERDRVKDTKGLRSIYLQELRDSDSKNMEFAGLVRDSYVNKVRTTLVLNYEQVQNLKNWVTDKCKDSHRTQHLSTFVVTSSLIWFCMVKSEESESKSDQDDCDVVEVHLDTTGSISLSDCRDGGGGIEVGLALERSRMASFINIFQQQLDSICSM